MALIGAQANATTINFVGSPGQSVGNDYSSLGVVFQNALYGYTFPGQLSTEIASAPHEEAPIGAGLFSLTFTGSTDTFSFVGSLYDVSVYAYDITGKPLAYYYKDYQPPELHTLNAVGIHSVTLGGGPAYFSSISFDSQVDAISSAPEPATWALMIIGFGLTGAALRRRKTGSAVSLAA